MEVILIFEQEAKTTWSKKMSKRVVMGEFGSQEEAKGEGRGLAVVN